VKDYFRATFGASAKEVNGVILLVVIFLASMLVPLISRIFRSEKPLSSEHDALVLDSLVALLQPEFQQVDSTFETFEFNPNTASMEELARLGFSELAISQILNYRKAGGDFREKKHLLKIYAIDSARVMQLYNYIELPDRPVNSVAKSKPDFEITYDSIADRPEPEVFVKVKFNLNTADTSILQTVKGIGPVLSKRIVAFRSGLGGFVDSSQLYEVYNLDSAVVTELLQVGYIPEEVEINRIYINTVDETRLSSHPYISNKQARLIIAYRNQHGNYASINELLKVYLVNETDIKRLSPYLSFELSE